MSNSRPPTLTVAFLLLVLSGASFLLGRLDPFHPASGRVRVHRPQPVGDVAEREIVANLMKRGAEIIPLQPVLGGTMGFYNAEDVHVLNERWVYALFEDGHHGGYMLLEYSRNVDGTFEWSVIAVEPF